MLGSVAGAVTVQCFGGAIIAVLSRCLELLTDGMRGPNRSDSLLLREIWPGCQFLDIRESGGDFVRLGLCDDLADGIARGWVGRLKGLLQDLRQLRGGKRVVDAGGVEAATEGEEKGNGGY